MRAAHLCLSTGALHAFAKHGSHGFTRRGFDPISTCQKPLRFRIVTPTCLALVMLPLQIHDTSRVGRKAENRAFATR